MFANLGLVWLSRCVNQLFVFGLCRSAYFHCEWSCFVVLCCFVTLSKEIFVEFSLACGLLYDLWRITWFGGVL